MSVIDKNILPYLHHLLKHYRAATPTSPRSIPSPPWPPDEILCTAKVQSWLADKLLNSDDIGKQLYEPHQGWQVSFWKRVNERVERVIASSVSIILYCYS